MADPDEQVVRFSVKELFLDLKSDLKRIEGKLEHLATQADLDALTTKTAAEIGALDTRVTTLETTSASNAAVASYRKWLIGLGLAFAADLALGLVQAAGVIR